MNVEAAREDVLSWYFGCPAVAVRDVDAFVEMVDRLIDVVRSEVRPLRRLRRVR